MILSEVELSELSKYIEKTRIYKEISNCSILITGANGMLGTGIIKWIVYMNEKYNTNISIYASTRDTNNVPSFYEKKDNITWCSFGREEITIKDRNIDYIVHGAAPTSREFFINSPVETFRVIVDSTERLLDFARKQTNCRFLLLSSMDIYGAIDSDVPVSEDYVSSIDPNNTRSGYPLGKKASEYLCHAYCREYGIDALAIRLSSVQGLFQKYDEPRIFNEILRCLVEKKNLVLKSQGNSKKCFLYTLDAISAIFKILIHGKKDEVYNTTNPESYITIRELAELIFSELNPELQVEYDIQDNTLTGYLPELSFVQDNSKIEKLGWKPEKNIIEIYRTDLKRIRGGA